jgi:hypothetical protein
VASHRYGTIFTAKFAGRSAWERHPQGDEIVQIVDGTTEPFATTEWVGNHYMG